MLRPILSVPALLLAVSFASQQPAAAAAKPEPCSLVSKADVQQVVGKPVADPKPNTTNPAVCDFKVGDFGLISFMVQPVNPGTTIDKIMSELKKRKIPAVEAKGIGDRSFFASPGYGMTQLNTYKGPHYIILTLMVPGAGEAQQKAYAEKLMPKALSKL